MDERATNTPISRFWPHNKFIAVIEKILGVRRYVVLEVQKFCLRRSDGEVQGA